MPLKSKYFKERCISKVAKYAKAHQAIDFEIRLLLAWTAREKGEADKIIAIKAFIIHNEVLQYM